MSFVGFCFFSHLECWLSHLEIQVIDVRERNKNVQWFIDRNSVTFRELDGWTLAQHCLSAETVASDSVYRQIEFFKNPCKVAKYSRNIFKSGFMSFSSFFLLWQKSLLRETELGWENEEIASCLRLPLLFSTTIMMSNFFKFFWIIINIIQIYDSQFSVFFF